LKIAVAQFEEEYGMESPILIDKCKIPVSMRDVVELVQIAYDASQERCCMIENSVFIAPRKFCFTEWTGQVAQNIEQQTS
jgi:hypothetical protein